MSRKAQRGGGGLRDAYNDAKDIDNYDDDDDYDYALDDYELEQANRGRGGGGSRGRGRGGRGGYSNTEDDPYDFIDVPVKKQFHSLIIGERGATIKQLRKDFGVDVEVPGKHEDKAFVTLMGGRRAIHACKKKILDLVGQKTVESQPRNKSGVLAASAVEDFPALPTQVENVIEIHLEKAFHGNFIGTRRARLDELIKSLVYGRVQGVEVKVPKKEDISSVISVHVPLYHVPAAKKIIREFLEKYELIGNLSRGSEDSIVVINLGAGTEAFDDKGQKKKTVAAPSTKKGTAPAPVAASATPTAAAATTTNTKTATTTASTPAVSAPPSATTNNNINNNNNKTSASSASMYQAHETFFDATRLRITPNGSATDPAVSGGYTHEVKPQRK